MASVYAGRLAGPAGFEKLVAIKVIHPHLSTESSFVNMFLDEARLAARIHHPNVGEIFEIGEEKGLFYMVGELIQGQSVRAFYQRAKSLGIDISQPIAAYIISRVSHGLQAAHDLRDLDGSPLNLVHRDISPRNIVISYSGFVKLIDFGVAWAQTRLSKTADGSIKGKVAYMPPEQIRGKQLDRRSDIFSLGVVLYLLSTGQHPFPGTSEAERMHKILNGKFITPRKANPSLSKQLEEIIMTAMATSPANRYESASQFAADLDRFAKVTGESIGSEELSVLMRLVFSEELSKNETRIREYRSRSSAREESMSFARPSSIPGAGASQPPGASPASMTPPAQSTLTPSDSDRVRLSPKKWSRKRLYAVAGVLLFIALAAVSIALFSGTSPPSDEQISDVTEPSFTGAEVLEHPGIQEGDTEANRGGDTSQIEISSPSDENQDRADDGDGKKRRFARKTKNDVKTALDGENTAPQAKSKADRKVRVELQIQPQPRRLLLDGKPIPRKRRALFLPGNKDTHTLTVQIPGYESETVEFVADQNKTLTIHLIRESRSKPKPVKKTTPSAPPEKKGGKLQKNPYG